MAVRVLHGNSSGRFDVIILGAGAAGLMCAIEAGKRGRSVALLEHNDSPGRKIRISGGGRCNFTNLKVTGASFLSANPHFCKSALARFTPADFISMVTRHGIAYHEKTLGQLFCDDSAQQVIDMLMIECRNAGVEVVTGCEIRDVTRAEGFECRTSKGVLRSPALVVATGGLSVPSLGATDFGHRIAQQFGLVVNDPRPGLVPLLWSEADRAVYGELSGVSMPVRASCGEAEFDEAMLFTHKGISGPAILQCSSFWKRGERVTIDLLPGRDVYAYLIEQRSRNVAPSSAFAELLPRRFAAVWCAKHKFTKLLSQSSNAELRAISEQLHAWEIIPAGTEGYLKAEVTVGGVSTDELSQKTLEAKKVPGLYFIGEVVDVTGHLGGFNFQWAWASGFAAGQAV